ncbi:unnamed protein product [Acanthosepion pharaonis]|uniref:Uncharacterized protein n=1 Tax=Acanthosepion pharaonis TaxID=158019 RepID=A0A812BJ98_ACAPH|nr:unnamed protein product [Sepia pharaonis]
MNNNVDFKKVIFTDEKKNVLSSMDLTGGVQGRERSGFSIIYGDGKIVEIRDGRRKRGKQTTGRKRQAPAESGTARQAEGSEKLPAGTAFAETPLPVPVPSHALSRFRCAFGVLRAPTTRERPGLLGPCFKTGRLSCRCTSRTRGDGRHSQTPTYRAGSALPRAQILASGRGEDDATRRRHAPARESTRPRRFRSSREHCPARTRDGGAPRAREAPRGSSDEKKPRLFNVTATTTLIFLEGLISDSPLDRLTATTVYLSLSTSLSSNAQVSPTQQNSRLYSKPKVISQVVNALNMSVTISKV